MFTLLLITVWAWVGKGVSDNMAAKKETSKTDSPQIVISRSHAGTAQQVVDKAFGADKGM